MDPHQPRDAATRVVESYFECVVSGDLGRLPVTHDYGSESPSSGRLHGRAAIDYLGKIGAEMSEIRIVQHIVEGDYVATHFEEVTPRGTLPAFAKFELERGLVKSVRVFFDTAADGA